MNEHQDSPTTSGPATAAPSGHATAAPSEQAPQATRATQAVVGTDQAPERREVRIRTVVFGLVALAVSVASLIGTVSPTRLNAGLLGLWLLIGAGAALLLGGLFAAVRDIRREARRGTG
jgi:hypothetical protein